jgi:protein SCO1/2
MRLFPDPSIDHSSSQTQGVVKVTPVFISVDPERDTPKKVKEYVREFSPRMIGLTGDMESVKKVSKQYRVYYSKTGDSKTDYLVDHSIIHYLINPAGDFVTFFSKSNSPEQMAEGIVKHAKTYQESHDSYHKGKKIA